MPLQQISHHILSSLLQHDVIVRVGHASDEQPIIFNAFYQGVLAGYDQENLSLGSYAVSRSEVAGILSIIDLRSVAGIPLKVHFFSFLTAHHAGTIAVAAQGVMRGAHFALEYVRREHRGVLKIQDGIWLACSQNPKKVYLEGIVFIDIKEKE